jgi:hypothetical protein
MVVERVFSKEVPREREKQKRQNERHGDAVASSKV